MQRRSKKLKGRKHEEVVDERMNGGAGEVTS
jgi:hypothetical protein